MYPFKYHVFVCTQQKAENVPCCCARGAAQIFGELKKELAAQGLAREIQVSTTGCLGLSEDGPNMVVYPEGVWYSHLTPQDIPGIVSSHFRDGKPVERLARQDAVQTRRQILDAQEHYLAACRAKDAAGTLPDDLMTAIRGFMEPRIFLTALELDLFTAVHGGVSAQEVAGKLGVNPRAVEMLLNALVAMDLLSKNGRLYNTTSTTARFFTAGSPNDQRLGALHMNHLWTRWSTLTEAVRAGTAVLRKEPNKETTSAFISAMDNNARDRAGLVVNSVGAGTVKRMLDLGGGSGAYSIAFASANPELQAVIMDLPEVLEITKGFIAKAGLGNRISLLEGDMCFASFGEGYDLVLLSAICHMFSPEENLLLFRKAMAALTPGGRLVVQEFILEADKTAPRWAAVFSLNMLVNTKAGASYSAPEYEDWMKQAGFAKVQHVVLPGPTGLMIGEKA